MAKLPTKGIKRYEIKSGYPVSKLSVGCLENIYVTYELYHTRKE